MEGRAARRANDACMLVLSSDDGLSRLRARGLHCKDLKVRLKKISEAFRRADDVRAAGKLHGGCSRRK